MLATGKRTRPWLDAQYAARTRENLRPVTDRDANQPVQPRQPGARSDPTAALLPRPSSGSTRSDDPRLARFRKAFVQPNFAMNSDPRSLPCSFYCVHGWCPLNECLRQHVLPRGFDRTAFLEWQEASEAYNEAVTAASEKAPTTLDEGTPGFGDTRLTPARTSAKIAVEAKREEAVALDDDMDAYWKSKKSDSTDGGTKNVSTEPTRPASKGLERTASSMSQTSSVEHPTRRQKIEKFLLQHGLDAECDRFLEVLTDDGAVDFVIADFSLPANTRNPSSIFTRYLSSRRKTDCLDEKPCQHGSGVHRGSCPTHCHLAGGCQTVSEGMDACLVEKADEEELARGMVRSIGACIIACLDRLMCVRKEAQR